MRSSEEEDNSDFSMETRSQGESTDTTKTKKQVSRKTKQKKNKKRKLEESLDMDGSFTGEEISNMTDAVLKVCNVINNLHGEIAAYPKAKTEIKDTMEELQKLSETMLKNTVIAKLEEKKNKVKEITPVNEVPVAVAKSTPTKKQYCERCAIVIENENAEKKQILEHIQKGLELTEEEFSTLIEKKWPKEVFAKTKLVTGNPLQSKSEHLILFYENIEEDSSLMKLVKEKYPEVNEVLVDEDNDEEEAMLPFIENTVKTRKGSNTKRIYLCKIEDTSDTSKVREVLKKCKTQMDNEQWKSVASAVSQTKGRKQIRKTMEVCFASMEGEIEFFVPRGETENERTPREREEALVIGTNITTYADTMRNIRAVLTPSDVGVNVKCVKTTKDKKVVIVTEKGDAETLKKEIESRFKNIETKVSGRGTSHTPIVILDIDASMNGKEIEYFIKQTTKIHETEIKHLRLGRTGTQIATVSMPSHAAEKLLREGEIKINWTICRVKPKINVIMCYNCLEMGHHSEICKSEKTEKKCLNCTQVGHLGKDCQNTSFCATCKREGHRTGSTLCPTHRRRVQDAAENIIKDVMSRGDDNPAETMDTEEQNDNTEHMVGGGLTT